MNRKELLTTAFSKDENIKTILSDIFEEDADFLLRAKRDLEDEVKDLEKQLKKRLKSEAVLDKAVIEVTYAGIQGAKAKLQLYKDFEKTYIKEGE